MTTPTVDECLLNVGCNSLHTNMLINNQCRKVVYDYCTGSDDLSNTLWTTRWPNECKRAVEVNLYSIQSNPCAFEIAIPQDGNCHSEILQDINSEGFLWSALLLQEVNKKLTSQNINILSNPDELGYTPLSDFLYKNICCGVPGLCQYMAQDLCQNTTISDLSIDSNKANWCGCYLPINEYQTYYDEGFNLNCVPLCNRNSSLSIGNNGITNGCQQSVCIIDDSTLLLANTSVGGNINITNICSSCAGSNCNCIINNTTSIFVQDTIGNNINLSQECGGLTCKVPNPNKNGPKTITVPCQKSEKFVVAKKSANVIKFLIILIIIVVMAIIALILR